METTSIPLDLVEDDFPQARVRFGPGKTQTMPAEWAETMLSAWREKDPKRFGDALAQAAMEAR